MTQSQTTHNTTCFRSAIASGYMRLNKEVARV
jgi:hypothetical protein